MEDDFWLGPTYEFRSEQWMLKTGIHGETGRLEWLLSQVDGDEDADLSSHSFVLEPHGTAADLELLLGDLPPQVIADLVAQVSAQTDPRLLSSEANSEGLA